MYESHLEPAGTGLDMVLNSDPMEGALERHLVLLRDLEFEGRASDLVGRVHDLVVGGVSDLAVGRVPDLVVVEVSDLAVDRALDLVVGRVPDLVVVKVSDLAVGGVLDLYVDMVSDLVDRVFGLAVDKGPVPAVGKVSDPEGMVPKPVDWEAVPAVGKQLVLAVGKQLVPAVGRQLVPAVGRQLVLAVGKVWNSDLLLSGYGVQAQDEVPLGLVLGKALVEELEKF